MQKRQEVNNSSCRSHTVLDGPLFPLLCIQTTRQSFLNLVIRTHCGSESFSRAVSAGTFSNPALLEAAAFPTRLSGAVVFLSAAHFFRTCCHSGSVMPTPLLGPCKEPAVCARTSALSGRAVILTLQFRDWRNAAWC